MIRVMLADDHEVVRVGFRMILEQDPDVRVVAEAADGAQGFTHRGARETGHPAHGHLHAPGAERAGGLREDREGLPRTKVVILTMFAEPEYLFYTLRGERRATY